MGHAPTTAAHYSSREAHYSEHNIYPLPSPAFVVHANRFLILELKHPQRPFPPPPSPPARTNDKREISASACTTRLRLRLCRRRCHRRRVGSRDHPPPPLPAPVPSTASRDSIGSRDHPPQLPPGLDRARSSLPPRASGLPPPPAAGRARRPGGMDGNHGHMVLGGGGLTFDAGINVSIDRGFFICLVMFVFVRSFLRISC